jgi:HEAT repeat protein
MSSGGSENAQLIQRALSGSDDERRDAVVTLEERGAREAVPELLTLVSHPDDGVRANVAHALGELGDERCGPSLRGMLDDREALVRLSAAESLGRLRDGASAAALGQMLLTDEDPLVRIHAAEALSRIGESESLPGLIRALDDTDAQVRAYAAVAIGDVGVEASANTLAAHLRHEQDIFARAHLLAALYRLGDRQALRRMTDLTAEADDVLATTILNLAAAGLSPDDRAGFVASLNEIGLLRPRLRLEAEELIQKLHRDHPLA